MEGHGGRLVDLFFSTYLPPFFSSRSAFFFFAEAEPFPSSFGLSSLFSILRLEITPPAPCLRCLRSSLFLRPSFLWVHCRFPGVILPEWVVGDSDFVVWRKLRVFLCRNSLTFFLLIVKQPPGFLHVWPARPPPSHGIEFALFVSQPPSPFPSPLPTASSLCLLSENKNHYFICIYFPSCFNRERTRRKSDYCRAQSDQADTAGKKFTTAFLRLYLTLAWRKINVQVSFSF